MTMCESNHKLNGLFEHRDLPEIFWPEYERPFMNIPRQSAEKKLGPLPDEYRFAAMTGNTLNNKPSQVLVVRPDGSSALLADLLNAAKKPSKAKKAPESLVDEVQDNTEGGQE